MPTPRIAVLCGISELGGAEISLLESVSRLRDRFEFHLIVPGEGRLKASAENAGAKTWVLPWPEPLARSGETSGGPNPARLLHSLVWLKPFTRNLGKLLAEINPTAFITNAIKAHFAGALAPRPKNVPLIWYVRDGLEERSVSRKLLALLSNRCDMAVCISRYVESEVRRFVSTSMCADFVYDIVDLDAFRPGIQGPRDLIKGRDEIWYGTVGAITPLKGIDVFLDAAEIVHEKLPNAAFLIVGTNSYATQTLSHYERELRSKADSDGLRGRVKFLGFRDDVPRVMSQLDVLVQSNRGPEGLGRSVLEAMACGVPVISVNKWGPAELIEHGQTGLLFPPLDRDALADRIIVLGKDAELRARLGTNSRTWIQQNFDPEELARRFETLLSDAIANCTTEAVLV